MPAAMMRACTAAAALSLVSAGCRDKPPVAPLKLEGNMLTVDNRSADDWTKIDIWLNRNHRVMVPKIAAGSRLQVPLDAFVAGFGQRFDYHRTQVTDVRLTATLSDGKPLELIMPFNAGGLAGVFGGKR
jgi:hypothetical protein